MLLLTWPERYILQSFYATNALQCLSCFQLRHYFILCLSHPQQFHSLSHANSVIMEIKQKYTQGYFDGQFKHICGDYYIYEFTTTLPASNATFRDLQIFLKESSTDSLLPPCEQLFTISLDIVCVSEQALNTTIKKAVEKAERVVKLALEAGLEADVEVMKAIKRACKQEAVGEVMKAKRAKRAREREGSGDEASASEEPPTKVRSLMFTKASENSIATHIVEQINKFAKSMGLVILYSNTSSIISKYALSTPDLATCSQTHAVIATPNLEKVVCITTQCENEEDEDDEDEILQRVSYITLTGEAKETLTGKDPIGRLLAGMDKTLGDMFIKEIYAGALLTTLTMYGVYFVSSEDLCDIVRADVKIGSPTHMLYGRTKLSISDAMNRIFSLLIKNS